MRDHPTATFATFALLLILGGRTSVRAGQECGVDDLFPLKEDGSREYAVAHVPADCMTVRLQPAVTHQGAGASSSHLPTPPPLGDLGASAVAVALIGNTMVTTVWLDQNGVGPVGAQALATALKVNTALVVLSLGGNEIGDAGLASLAEALKASNVLTALIVGNNQIGPAGAELLGHALEVNTGLQQLYLQNNKLGDAGELELSKALKVNHGVSHLMLQNTGIGPEGAYAVGDMLKTNRKITTLHMQGNAIGVAGGMVMGDVLSANSALVTLELESNGIGSPGAIVLAEGLAKNKKLYKLGLENNGISNAGAAKLASVLAERNSDLMELALGDGQGSNLVEQSTQKTIDMQLAINNDPASRLSKQLRISPCLGLTAELHCGGHGSLATASEEQKPNSAGATCVCNDCSPGFSGLFCQVGPCHGKTSEMVCNGRGRPFVSMETKKDAQQNEVASAVCKCVDCLPWYKGDSCETYNPCGPYTDCKSLVGGAAVLDHFLKLDMEYLQKLGVRSVVDLLLLRDDADIPGIEVRDSHIGHEVDAHLNMLTKPLSANDRQQFISALETAAPLVFSTGDAALHFNNTVPLSLWGDSIHLPPAVVGYLVSLGMDEPGDLIKASENDMNYMRVGDVPPNPHNDGYSLGVDDKYESGRPTQDDGGDTGANPGAAHGTHAFADTAHSTGGFAEGALKAKLKHVDILRLVATAESMRGLLVSKDEEHTQMMFRDALRDQAEDAEAEAAATPTAGPGTTRKSWKVESKREERTPDEL